MITKKVVNISLDKDVLKDARFIFKREGIKLSSFMEAVLRSVVESETLPMKNVYENMVYKFMKDKMKKRK